MSKYKIQFIALILIAQRAAPQGAPTGTLLETFRALRADNQRFDIVVVDPPAFVKKKKDLPKTAS